MAYEKNDRRPNRKGRKKVCAFCVDKVECIDYKDTAKLHKYISDRAKILPEESPATAPLTRESLPPLSSVPVTLLFFLTRATDKAVYGCRIQRRPKSKNVEGHSLRPKTQIVAFLFFLPQMHRPYFFFLLYMAAQM